MAISSKEKNVPDNQIIEVVGNGKYPYGKIKGSVVELSGEYYFRDSDLIVKLKDQSGKSRYYRKASLLVKEIEPGVFALKANVVKTIDGLFLDKTSPDTVILNGSYTKKSYTVEVDGKLYLRTDPTLVKCSISGNMVLKNNAVELVKEYYGAGTFVSKLLMNELLQIEEGWINKGHAVLILTKEGDYKHYHNRYVKKRQVSQVFYKFKDETNPQLDRMDFVHMFNEDIGETIPYNDIGGYLVHKKHFEKVKAIYENVILMKLALETKKIKDALKYSDDGPDENRALKVKKINNPWPGKANVYTPSVMEPVIGRTFVTTGGLRYTFGVELETSQGLVPNPIAEELQMKIVGDRSIGAGEYVTHILAGDLGMRLLEKQCKAIADHCFVDDKCGLHVHVGGPDYNRHFCINAVKLGAMIEPELYASCPPNRLPTFKHCHSILRFAGINESNWKQYLGAYVFGPREVWENQNDQSMWSFTGYEYGKDGQNKKQKLDNWNPGRYKWLNLCHILSSSKINTLEFRIFAGTTSFEKVRNYVLTSLAFTWFVENRINLIEAGNVKLKDVVTIPFIAHGKPELAEELWGWYRQRIKRFGRTIDQMYPKTIPASNFDLLATPRVPRVPLKLTL